MIITIGAWTGLAGLFLVALWWCSELFDDAGID